MKNIAEEIKARRKSLGLSQEEVAARVGVSKSAVCRWESGDIKSMKRNRVAALATVLHMDPVDLVMPEISERYVRVDDDMTDAEGRLLMAFRQIPVDDQEMFIKLIEGHRKG